VAVRKELSARSLSHEVPTSRHTGAALLFGDSRGRGLRFDRALLAGLARAQAAGTGSLLGSSFDMLVMNFLTPCSSNWTGCRRLQPRSRIQVRRSARPHGRRPRNASSLSPFEPANQEPPHTDGLATATYSLSGA